MREIAAASDFDFVALEPRRSAHAGARKRGKGQNKASAAQASRFAALWRYRTPAFGAALLCAMLGAIAVNAMFLQHGRHPAPLFGSTVKIEPPRAPKPPARPTSIDALINERIPAAPLQPVNAAPEAAFSAPAVDDQPAAEAAAQAPVASVAVAPAKKTRDVIGALIAGNGVVTPAMSSRSVTSAQRALQKLGAPVKPDGDYGAATRKAVEAFQRDNHLAVTGELNAKTRKALSARSGLPVD
ncbi:MAG: peptidoglycan-binding domain-containing protein [Beijerinckiaceae bacterium]|nr:peptidoglycan-binding domain-containing protein [Beijerinckiaceae bacterium]